MSVLLTLLVAPLAAAQQGISWRNRSLSSKAVSLQHLLPRPIQQAPASRRTPELSEQTNFLGKPYLALDKSHWVDIMMGLLTGGKGKKYNTAKGKKYNTAVPAFVSSLGK